jgi:hypothetical protein
MLRTTALLLVGFLMVVFGGAVAASRRVRAVQR